MWVSLLQPIMCGGLCRTSLAPCKISAVLHSRHLTIPRSHIDAAAVYGMLAITNPAHRDGCQAQPFLDICQSCHRYAGYKRYSQRITSISSLHSVSAAFRILLSIAWNPLSAKALGLQTRPLVHLCRLPTGLSCVCGKQQLCHQRLLVEQAGSNHVEHLGWPHAYIHPKLSCDNTQVTAFAGPHPSFEEPCQAVAAATSGSLM